MDDLASVQGTSLESSDPNTRGADDKLIALWLHGRPAETVRAYREDVDRLRRFTSGARLAQLTLGDLQAYADALTGSENTRARRLTSIRSLLRFGHRLGVLAVNVAGALRTPKPRDTLAARIMTEDDVRAMKAAARSPREAALLAVLYEGAFRRSEICGLRWRDCVNANDGGAYVTVLGKRQKTRTVRISPRTWALLEQLREGGPDHPVFVGRSGALESLTPKSLWRIVRALARRAGLEQSVSPHWLRHAHASHALEHGAPIHVVQATLGHESIGTTGRYLHARPSESSGRYLPD